MRIGIVGHKYLNMSKNEETSNEQINFLLNLNNSDKEVKEPMLLTT